jgi:endonuclease YncB( thermonuclease family)
MKNTPDLSRYSKLLADIGRVYENARHVLVGAYWKIGRRIVKEEQQGAARAPYGDRLLAQLSADLSSQYGAGFSADNLERMRKFYLTHPISAPARKLGWSQYVEILAVDDDKTRKQLEWRAEDEDLSRRELRKLVRETTGQESVTVISPKRALSLRRPTGMRFRTYRIADAPDVTVRKGHILVDCGFNIFHNVPKATRGFHLADNPSYTYAAIVERVVDGDTVWALIDIGFDTVARKKLRLHGVDAPELTTAAGAEAHDHVARILPPGAAIVIRSYASDAFGRFLADIFCPKQPVTNPTAKTYDRILASGVFLNQDLIARRLAVRTVL